MARKRRPNEKSSYKPAPKVPPELADRYQVVALVIAEQLSVSEGARRLGMARANFQTLVNRTKESMVTTLMPRPTGPTPHPAEQAALSHEVETLRKDNERLTQQLETMDRLLGAAGDVIRGLRQPARPRTSKTSPRRSTPSSSDDDEEPPATLNSTQPTTCPTPTGSTSAMSTVMTMREPGATWRRRARALGVGASTLRRHARRGVPGPRPSRARPPSAESATAIRGLVRQLRGLAGAASLGKSVTGVSRRQAASIKRDELTAMERDRKASASRVEVPAPGVIRGFDALETRTAEGRRWVLAAGDASVPYRTSLEVVERYDARAVATALDADFAAHGPPLVLRLDRASCHRAPSVVSLLERWRVLPLHGPPRYPRYYGQLERQNREHRAWLAAHGAYSHRDLVADCSHLRTVLNGQWRRPTLEWRTAECVWEQRGELAIDRDELRDAVADGAARRLRAGLHHDLAWRLAVENVLTNKNLLRLTPKPKVLCAH
ncbi:MAG TPA: hypothetical protein VFU04_04805 [Solirubrobacterales bacterium]|nr:hypothetical protein [Solirubrobacterales bacterium]